ncbi:MAG: hypothetical protein DRR00_20135, partial [Candidatus Parabeggiatoa sp. nov. 3]
IETTKKRGNHKGLPLRAGRRGNPLWLPLAVKYLFICASVLTRIVYNKGFYIDLISGAFDNIIHFF